MDYQKLSPEEVDGVWSTISHWVDIARGVDQSFSVDDIKKLCKAGIKELWIARDDDTIKGFLIGGTSIRPQGKVYHAAWLGGEDLALWVDGLKIIRDQCKEAGYFGCSWYGREAWKKLVGYDYHGCYYFVKL